MRRIQKIIISLLFLPTFWSCTGFSQDSPQDIVNAYAQSMCDMDIEGMASCFEYGVETLEFVDAYINEGDNSIGDMQYILSAAKESELVPEITYEIVEEEIDGEKGVVRVKFDYYFDDGENTHHKTEYEDISVYCHDGLWWIGEGYSERDREMERRFMNFMNKLGDY